MTGRLATIASPPQACGCSLPPTHLSRGRAGGRMTLVNEDVAAARRAVQGVERGPRRSRATTATRSTRDGCSPTSAGSAADLDLLCGARRRRPAPAPPPARPGDHPGQQYSATSGWTPRTRASAGPLTPRPRTLTADGRDRRHDDHHPVRPRPDRVRAGPRSPRGRCAPTAGGCSRCSRSPCSWPSSSTRRCGRSRTRTTTRRRTSRRSTRRASTTRVRGQPLPGAVPARRGSARRSTSSSSRWASG